MLLSARYQAVLDILEQVWEDLYPADNIIKEYLHNRKYIGSKDRKFITDTVWDIIRHRSRLEFEAQTQMPRKILLCYLKNEDFDIVADGSKYGLSSITPEEKNFLRNLKDDVYPENVEKECPLWLYNKINNKTLIDSLNSKASVDIRANFIGRDEAQSKLRKEGLFFSSTPYSPYGLRSEERIFLQNCITYQNGEIEIQDESSQIAAILCDVKPNHKIIDYCCGGGGKSLMLASILNNQGTIYAHDINVKRMEGLDKRSNRLGVKNIKIISDINSNDMFDRFIIDAPCSGSGTWRRSPDAKYRLTPEKLQTIKNAQAEILNIAAAHLSKEGKIVYMTCSVLPEENEDRIEDFLEKHREFETVDMEKLWLSKFDTNYPGKDKRYLHCSPLATNTDGFFVCILQKK